MKTRFSELLRSIRERKGYSRTELSKKLGVSPQYVINIENGYTRTPTITRCHQIAEALDLTPTEKDQIMSMAIFERSKPELRPFLNLPENELGRIAYPMPTTPDEYVSIPVLGTCPASPRLIAEEEILSRRLVPKSIASGRKLYLLKVKGDSMNRAGIDDGDLILIEHRSDPVNGQIVVACVDDGFSIKRYHREKGLITLMPDSTNPKHMPEVIDLKKHDVRLGGVVKAVYMKEVK